MELREIKKDGSLNCRAVQLEKERAEALFLELWTRACDFLFLRMNASFLTTLLGSCRLDTRST